MRVTSCKKQVTRQEKQMQFNHRDTKNTQINAESVNRRVTENAEIKTEKSRDRIIHREIIAQKFLFDGSSLQTF